jgi:hypothetical protein
MPPPTGLKLNFGFGFYKYAAPTALRQGGAAAPPKLQQCDNCPVGIEIE